jgi:carbon storage regulator CsrA
METAMLILSRRATESIDFPQLGISVSIVSVKGCRVQVGVDAPPEIRIIRRELATSSPEAAVAAVAGDRRNVTDTPQATHEFRNQLNKATLGLHLAQKQLAAGFLESANTTLTKALARLTELEQVATADSTHGGNCVKPAQRSADNRKREPAPISSSDEAAEPVDVLLVEDDLNEQALLRGILEMEGYRVQTASNGHEALACLRSSTPRFVLLDMLMPECNGRETLHQIRQVPAWQHLPVFAVSGSSPNSLGLSIGKAGVDDWFPKPLNAPRLVHFMRERVANLCV